MCLFPSTQPMGADGLVRLEFVCPEGGRARDIHAHTGIFQEQSGGLKDASVHALTAIGTTLCVSPTVPGAVQATAGHQLGPRKKFFITPQLAFGRRCFHLRCMVNSGWKIAQGGVILNRWSLGVK